ncbi:MAG: glycosyltransferase family 4 protein [Sphingomonadaceae bacterium]
MDPSDLRVALFSGNYNYIRDGANQALNRLVGYLLGRGVAVRVYSPTVRNPAFAPTGDLVSIPSLPVPGRSEYRAPLMIPPSVKEDIRRFDPTIFHIASPEILGHRAVSLAHRMGVPVVASVHTRFETYARYYGMAFLEPIMVTMLRRLYNRCDAIFAPSQSMARLLREERMNAHVHIWSRGIDRDIFSPERSDPAWRRALGIADDSPAVGFLGRLVMEKGLETFAEAVAALRERGVRHEVIVIGDGPAREWFEKRLPEAHFVGFRRGEDLGRAVASMDVLLNPSVTETFGNVTLEALAAGVPVVAARATGSESLIEHGVTGMLVPPDATEEFADALQIYCRDDERRREAGKAGRRFSRKFGWDRVNQAMLEGYIEILERARDPPRRLTI